MSGSGYASRQEAIQAAQEAMRATFGAEIHFEPIRAERVPKTFRVLDDKGKHLDSFGVFRSGTGKWAWQQGSPLS
jgi:hypothetical protein